MTNPQAASPSADPGSASDAFLSAVLAHQATAERFRQGTLSALDHSREREQALGDAMVALAASMGVRLQEPLWINSHGEFSFVALDPSGRDPRYGTGQFGVALTELLNAHRPRTGIAPGRLDEANGWCYMNHFEVENLVLGHHAELVRQAQAQAGSDHAVSDHAGGDSPAQPPRERG